MSVGAASLSSKIDFEQVKADYVRIVRSDSALELDTVVGSVNQDLPLFSRLLRVQMQTLDSLRMRAELTPASESIEFQLIEFKVCVIYLFIYIIHLV